MHANNTIPKVSGNRISRFRRDSRFESSFTKSDPRLLSKKFFSPLLYNGARLRAERVCPIRGVSLISLQPVNPVLKPTSERKPMEQIKRKYFGGATFEARTVKDIIVTAKSIFMKDSVTADFN